MRIETLPVPRNRNARLARAKVVRFAQLGNFGSERGAFFCLVRPFLLRETSNLERWLPLTIYLSLLVALIGVLAYALATNPKVQEIGRISYFAGLLAFLLVIAGAHVLPVLR